MAGYIEKKAAVGLLESMSRCADCGYIVKQLKKAAKHIDSFRTVDVAPVVHGRWEPINEDCFVCSACGKCSIQDYYYCPECGAEMGGGADNG